MPAFDDFVAARGQALLRYAYLVAGDGHTAEDLVQSALAKAYGRWSRVQATGHPEAYVKRMVLNEHLSWRRRRASSEVVAAALPASVAADAHAATDERDVVWRLLAGLPRRQRVVLVLRFYEDLPDDAIAAELGCAPGTVRSLASRGLAALRAHPSLQPTTRSPRDA